MKLTSFHKKTNNICVKNIIADIYKPSKTLI